MPGRQRGAVLYVALIMLILLALLGLVGMQVTAMQERMSANYGRVHVAFQNAEALVRQREALIRTSLYDGSGTFAANEELCSATFDPSTWASKLTSPNAVYTRRIDKCFSGSSLKVGTKKNEETGNIYQITALRGDVDTNPAATAVIDTIFIP
jgi:type IV pilus assembly protein PilX